MKRASCFHAISLIASLVLGSGPILAQTPGVTDTTIKIGFLGSLTGPAAIFGSGDFAGATIAFEELNEAGGLFGRKVELVVADDESSAPKGIAGFNKLIQSDTVFAVFGPTSSSVGVPMKGLMESSGVPVFIASMSSPDMTHPLVKNIFRTGSLNDRLQGRAIINYLTQNQKFERIAILRQSDQYGATGAAALLDRMKDLKLDPAAVEVFNASDTDLTAQVLKLRAANPQAIVVWGYPGASAIATRQIREVGIKADIIGSSATSNQNYPEMVGKLGVGVKFVLVVGGLPESDFAPVQKYRQVFQKRFPDLARQSRPAVGDLLGYGGALNMIEGLRRAGRSLTRESFMTALETLKDFETGVTQPSTLSATRHEGNTRMQIAIITSELKRELLPGVINAE